MSSVLDRYVHEPAEQLRSLSHQIHRPWPLPSDPWVIGQSWLDLLFAHWRVPAAQLARVLPPQLPIDQFDGSAWIGITPFQLEAFRPRPLPPLPVVSNFPELNVRTYVTVDGRPGIFFFSLNTPSRLAIAAARSAYLLPYRHAQMRIERIGEQSFSTTAHRDRDDARIDLHWRPRGEVFTAEPGSLEHFLTERYCLYVVDDAGTVKRADIHHRPWPLQHADADVEQQGFAPAQIRLDGPPVAHYSAQQDVVIWALRDV